VECSRGKTNKKNHPKPKRVEKTLEEYVVVIFLKIPLASDSKDCSGCWGFCLLPFFFFSEMLSSLLDFSVHSAQERNWPIY